MEKIQFKDAILPHLKDYAGYSRKAEKLRQQIAALNADRKALDNLAEASKEAIESVMHECGVNEVNFDGYHAYYSKPTGSVEIIDEAGVPVEFIEYVPKFDKNAIKKAVKDQPTNYARLVYNKTLKIDVMGE